MCEYYNIVSLLCDIGNDLVFFICRLVYVFVDFKIYLLKFINGYLINYINKMFEMLNVEIYEVDFV